MAEEQLTETKGQALELKARIQILESDKEAKGEDERVEEMIELMRRPEGIYTEETTEATIRPHRENACERKASDNGSSMVGNGI